MRVIADRDVCISAGMCVMTAEAVFDQDDDGIVVVSPGRCRPTSATGCAAR